MMTETDLGKCEEKHPINSLKKYFDVRQFEDVEFTAAEQDYQNFILSR